MGYQRNEGRFDRGRSYGGPRERYERGGYGRGYEYDRDRGSERSSREYRDYDPDDRGFFERAGDEVRSWFGDEEAERRRRRDERDYEQQYGRDYRDSGYRPGGSPSYGSGAGDYGAGYGAGATSVWGLGAGRDREAWGYDPYRSWRTRQMQDFDRDYDEYRREHQSKFEQDFGSWRQNRQTQRQSLRQVTEHQEVVGSDGQHIGTVDHVRGDRILLTKSDQDAGRHHHSIPCSWIKQVGEKVEISKTADEARKEWKDEENRSAFLGEEDRQREEGPHNLNRSFSGTY